MAVLTDICDRDVLIIPKEQFSLLANSQTLLNKPI